LLGEKSHVRVAELDGFGKRGARVEVGECGGNRLFLEEFVAMRGGRKMFGLLVQGKVILFGKFLSEVGERLVQVCFALIFIIFGFV